MVKRIFGLSLFFFGLFLISDGFYNLAKRQGFFVVKERLPVLNTISEEPTRIEIANTKINLPIFATKIVNEKWPTSESGVSYLQDSGHLGVDGNLIMYGHNWTRLLGNLKRSKVGDNLIILSNQGHSYQFQIRYIAVVDAHDVSILADTKSQRITLYTCIGLFDSQRFVVVAERVKG